MIVDHESNGFGSVCIHYVCVVSISLNVCIYIYIFMCVCVYETSISFFFFTTVRYMCALDA